MTEKLILREYECGELKRCFSSGRSELVIVYGRRRIGKTFLVEQYFKNRFDFLYVGKHGLVSKQQLRRFAKVLRSYTHQKAYNFSDWFDAFDALEEYLETLPNKKKVIFIDEMPWIDTRRSNFVVALENFWNGWAARRQDIMLIAAGSDYSWIKDKIVGNRGGLHARITCQLHISAFNLNETKQYLKSRGFTWDNYHILQAYMLLGGVPYYYSLLDNKLSLKENIDLLCFNRDGKLLLEFDALYATLFSNVDLYIEIVKTLSMHKYGLTFTELSHKIHINGTNLSRALKNLERCDFIEGWSQFGNKKRNKVYRLIDFYTLFYFKFLENNTKDEKWWTNNLFSHSVEEWMGISFQLVCLIHRNQIKKALGISGVATQMSTWQCKAELEEQTLGAQIDLIIERADRMIHFCEIKFSFKAYDITVKYEKELRDRMWLFDEKTKNKKPLVHTFITTFGLGEGRLYSIVHSEVTMNDLFA
ncbi:MAG: AAA family ATPase [Prevotella sp.]|nr:AAA family ATPase [Prevotella sp.]